MTDLGIYNFIRNELAQGQPKELITATLAKQGMSDADIAAAFESVGNNETPVSQIHSAASSSVTSNPQTLNTVSVWNEFRSQFWKYTLISFVLGLFAGLLKIGVFTFVVDIIAFVLQVLIAITIGKAAKALSGKPHTFLAILGFFFPPAGYYYVYTIGKKQSPDLSLNIFEWIYVILGLIAYFLVIIAVVGIISAIVLAGFSLGHSNIQSEDTSYSNQNISYSIGNAAALKSDLDTVLTQSAIFYDAHNTYGTSTDCYSSGMFTDPIIISSLKDSVKNSPYPPMCQSNGANFIVEQRLVDDPNQYWCVDSNAHSQGIPTAKALDSYSCE
jgi:hypothetical protein